MYASGATDGRSSVENEHPVNFVIMLDHVSRLTKAILRGANERVMLDTFVLCPLDTQGKERRKIVESGVNIRIGAGENELQLELAM